MKTPAAVRIAAATGIAVLMTGVLPAPAHAGAPAVKRKILPVLVEFSDASFQFPDKVKASTPDTYFGAGKDSAASFMTEVSRGQYTFVPAVDEKFVGPLKLPISAAGCKHGEINSLTRDALAKQGLVAGEDYDSISIVFPAQKTDCPWAGLASVPGPNTWINLYGTVSGLGVLGHELGHNLGLGHQGRLACAGGDLGSCKSGGTSGKSLMGGGGPAAGFTAPEHIRAGWLSGSTVEVTKSGTYTLRALHGTGSGTRALDIALGGDRLVLEYRHRAGNLDAAIEGVHAYRVPGGAYGSSSLIDPTPAKKGTAGADAVSTLRDKANKVAVAVLSSGGGQAEIRVALNGDPLRQAKASPSASASVATSAGASAAPSASSSPSPAASEPVTATGHDSAASPAVAGPATSLTASDTGSHTLAFAAAGGAALAALAVGALVLKRRPRGKHA